MPISYWGIVLVTLVIGMAASGYVRSQLKKYRRVPSSAGVTGAQMAQQMLAAHGIYNVPVHRGGPDQDHFDPRTNSITLDPEAYSGTSITAIATACHEAGHACQFAEGYAPMKIRGALVPAVNLCSNLWMILLIAGIFLNIAGLYTAAIVMYGVAVLFQVVTLPVEFNASRRAMVYLNSVGMPSQEQGGAFSVLRACALTYVAAALSSLLQLVYLLGLRNEE